jgi:hypothetical protein
MEALVAVAAVKLLALPLEALVIHHQLHHPKETTVVRE